MKKLYSYCLPAVILFAVSCSAPRKAVYFNTDEPISNNTVTVDAQPRPEVIISPDDIIAINITSVDAFVEKDPTSIFNDGGVPYAIAAQSGMGGAGASVKGYLVDAEGNIDFPVIGLFKVGNMTPSQVKAVLANELKKYIKSPVVEVRIINYKVTMLGEVTRVGPVIAPNHKINILEAIAAAGDIPITGRRDNVLIIRENKGKKEFTRMNLNSKRIFSDPNYYLQKNDIVYVEPNKLKRQETNEFLRFYLPAISTIVGSVLSIYGIIQITRQN